ncbi:MAG: hypothetical protein V3U71_09500 [Cocleimonas sp.]
MKSIKLFIITTLALTILTACGGGSSNETTSVAPTPSPDRATNPVNPSSPSSTPVNPTSPTTDSTELVIDNGRGTTNGHETELPK